MRSDYGWDFGNYCNIKRNLSQQKRKGDNITICLLFIKGRWKLASWLVLCLALQQCFDSYSSSCSVTELTGKLTYKDIVTHYMLTISLKLYLKYWPLQHNRKKHSSYMDKLEVCKQKVSQYLCRYLASLLALLKRSYYLEQHALYELILMVWRLLCDMQQTILTYIPDKVSEIEKWQN